MLTYKIYQYIRNLSINCVMERHNSILKYVNEFWTCITYQIIFMVKIADNARHALPMMQHSYSISKILTHLLKHYGGKLKFEQDNSQ